MRPKLCMYPRPQVPGIWKLLSAVSDCILLRRRTTHCLRRGRGGQGHQLPLIISAHRPVATLLRIRKYCSSIPLAPLSHCQWLVLLAAGMPEPTCFRSRARWLIYHVINIHMSPQLDSVINGRIYLESGDVGKSTLLHK